MILLTRRYRFAASHRLHVPRLTAGENQELFGKCNNPFGHGHNYILSVTVAGPVDKVTGLIVNLDLLDRLVDEKVLRFFRHKNLNADLPHFAELVPTTENVVLVIADLLAHAWSGSMGRESGARLVKVHVAETERNEFELVMKDAERKVPAVRAGESVMVNG